VVGVRSDDWSDRIGTNPNEDEAKTNKQINKQTNKIGI
jgi:hypothetical protein